MWKLETEAVPFYYYDIGEADRVVTFFSKRAGRITAFANGARRVKNKFGGMLEPFNEIMLSVHKKKEADNWKVSDVQVVKQFTGTSRNIDKAVLASYASKLVISLTGEEAEEENIYALFLTLLRLLEERNDTMLLARLFEIKLFLFSGHKLEVERCSNCRTNNSFLIISVSSGGTVCQKCAPLLHSKRGITPGAKAFIKMVQDIDLQLIGRLKAVPSTIEELKSINSDFLSFLTGKNINQPV